MANPPTKQTRTGMIKFDYDASKPDEINVLAKEVRKLLFMVNDFLKFSFADR